VLESLHDNVALHWCRKFLVFDKVPTQAEIQELRRDTKKFNQVARGPKWVKMWTEKRQAYTEYCKTLTAMKEEKHPALFNVELVFLEDFGHLFGTVREAFQGETSVSTPYVLVTQHDLKLARTFVAADVQRVLEALSGSAKYIVLNRDANSGDRSLRHFRIENETERSDTDAGPLLTAICGFSDQTHFARTDWYKAEVIEEITKMLGGDEQLTCMEHILHEPWKERPSDGKFLYGGLNDGPYVHDFIHGMQVLDEHGRLTGLPSMPSRTVGVNRR
jgi:hypothetical protein